MRVKVAYAGIAYTRIFWVGSCSFQVARAEGASAAVSPTLQRAGQRSFPAGQKSMCASSDYQRRTCTYSDFLQALSCTSQSTSDTLGLAIQANDHVALENTSECTSMFDAGTVRLPKALLARLPARDHWSAECNAFLVIVTYKADLCLAPSTVEYTKRTSDLHERSTSNTNTEYERQHHTTLASILSLLPPERSFVVTPEAR